MSTKSVAEVRNIFEEFLPEKTYRLRSLSFFAESIWQAAKYAPDAWVVVVPHHQKPWRIKLNVGNLLLFTIHNQKLWISLDTKTLKANSHIVEYLSENPSWQWDNGQYSHYKRVSSRNGYYFPEKDPSAELLSIVKKLNFAFIKQVGAKNYKLRSSSRKAHVPEILTFLRQELQEDVPDPGFIIDAALPEEGPDNKNYYEGTRKQISVNRYERDPRARRACLEHYGFKCAVCDKEMSEIYGAVAEGIIHVHHLKPLSDIQKGYKVDPIQDLRPVCPNCHAVIHRCNPPYKIEEVRSFLKKAM